MGNVSLSVKMTIFTISYRLYKCFCRRLWFSPSGDLASPTGDTRACDLSLGSEPARVSGGRRLRGWSSYTCTHTHTHTHNTPPLRPHVFPLFDTG